MEVRKGSMVNVNPTNTRPPNDTPEIRKYKKRFNSEILCAALWGEKQRKAVKPCSYPLQPNGFPLLMLKVTATLH